ncbi:tropomodulin-like isoform X4 [Amphibalanus amphitrite]|uniref:tropomodulin-like isoform X4 n=2 Tax=Amphibalanus amphitrite TaxID=1232801 RepID=UPI001C925130|nr:tropomodulin-like isoform X4 [Amphibalanus amphitrite]
MDRDRWGHDQPEPAGAGSDDSDSEYEEITTTTRTVKKTTYNPKPLVEALRSKEMGANKKLFGKDLSEYDNMDMDDMLDQLTAEEIELLTRDVDPDDSLMPPDQRTSYRCDKSATGPLNRKQLIDHINEQAMTEPDRPELVPYEPGTIRGKKWVPPPPPAEEQRADEQVALDMGDEYESALADATESEMVDLAAILGFHSMMNQDQYHASLLGKKLDTEEVGWSGITRASRPKAMAPEPPNTTDPEQSIERIKRDDPELRRLNLNNVKTISEEQFGRLCEAASANSRLEGLLCSNTHMGDTYAEKLVQLIENNPNIKEISIESNFISPPMIARLVKALLVHKSVETFRAANQRSQVLGNKIEMEITKYVEQNPNLLQFGLHFDFNDARARVCNQLQKNRDRFRTGKRSRLSCTLFRDLIWKKLTQLVVPRS